MLIVMEMNTGKIVRNEFGTFEDEVMNAEWLLREPALELGLQEVRHHADRPVARVESEAFLRQMYLAQR